MKKLQILHERSITREPSIQNESYQKEHLNLVLQWSRDFSMIIYTRVILNFISLSFEKDKKFRYFRIIKSKYTKARAFWRCLIIQGNVICIKKVCCVFSILQSYTEFCVVNMRKTSQAIKDCWRSKCTFTQRFL